MRNPLPEEGLRVIVLVSLIVLLKGFPCFHDFCGQCFSYIYAQSRVNNERKI